MTDYTFDIWVNLGKDAQTAAEEMTVTHATLRCLTRKFEGVGHM
jgi:hypothetical protein